MGVRVVSVVGARPQFIKLLPVHRALVSKGFEHIVIHTGQHYDPGMSGDMFADLGLPEPDVHLGVGPDEPPRQLARMVEALEVRLEELGPDRVLVYGDTTTTLAGAVAASKLTLGLCHVEAGLRSGNILMAEEVARRVADRISGLLFAPTRKALENLSREGMGAKAVLVGDVMLDSFELFAPRARAVKYYREIGLERPYALATLHRAENVDSPEVLSEILTELQKAARLMPVAFPVHPRTQKRVEEWGLVDLLVGLRVIQPIPYIKMLSLLTSARAVITDSGGLQKEAFFARVPCLTLRNETEWTETTEAGANVLLPRGCGIREHLERIIKNPPEIPDPRAFGNGRAGERIAEALS